MQQRCPASGKSFEISDADLEFYDRVSPTVGGVKLVIPPPTLSPDERQRRRLAVRNERHLYKSRCAITGKPVISYYSPDKPLKVCQKDIWLTLDNRDFGREFDFSRPFFPQFAELTRDTYKANVIQAGEMHNSDYAHCVGFLKNCYLVFDMGKSEDCMYCLFAGYSKNCVDCTWTIHCELCYESIKLEHCYNVIYSAFSKGCNLSSHLHSCVGCSDCLCCANLHNKRFHFLNEYVGEQKFRELWAHYVCGSYSRIQELQMKFDELLLQVPRKATYNLNCENVLGDLLSRCENVIDSYNCVECKDCRYCNDLYCKTSDCYDIATFGEGMQYCYEASCCGGALGKAEVSNIFFSNYVFYGGYNIFYSTHCHENSQNLFGCSDLRRQSFCILNKQYSPEEYQALAPKIYKHMQETGEWGEFFPMSISLIGYNESLAQELYPAAPEELASRGAWRSDYIPDAAAVGSTVIDAASLPDLLQDAPQLGESALVCAVTNKPFRLIASELAFYRTHNLPVPRLHSEERHRRRLRFLNPRALWPRECASCNVGIDSSFAPDRKEIVYCEDCYLKQIG